MKNKSAYFILFSSVVCSCVGTDESMQNSNEDSLKSELTINLTDIVLPFGEEKIPFVVINVNPEKDTVIGFESGSYLDIPKNAFVDDKGVLIIESVEIKFREFHDPVDFFASGIPMTLAHDETGTTYFQSAGMMEITATSSGKEVFPNPESKINVGLASQQKGNDYPLQFFTPGKGWEEIGKTENVTPQQMDSVLEINVPAPPKRLPPNIVFFGVDDESADEKPELAKYRNFTFIPLPGSPCSGNNFIKKLEVKDKGKGVYQLTITEHNQTVRKCDCERVYTDGEYASVNSKFLDKYGPLVRKQLVYSISQANMRRHVARVNRAFTVDNFGIYNCDRVVRMNIASCSFKSNVNKNLHFSAIDYTENAIYPCANGDQITINEKNEVALYGADEKGVIYFVSTSKLKKAKKGNLYELDLIKCESTASLDDLKKLLRD